MFKYSIRLSYWAMLVLALVACEKQPTRIIDGQWHRWVKVPSAEQGRCYEETLTIHDDDWTLTFLMHTSFLCNQPTLEIVFEGDVEDVTPSSSSTLPWYLYIEEIAIARVTNITNNERQTLKNKDFTRFDKQFITLANRRFVQKLWVKKEALMVANLYSAAQAIASPDASFKPRLSAYEKQKDKE